MTTPIDPCPVSQNASLFEDLAEPSEAQMLHARGLAKVKCVVRLYVLAHNLMRMATLAPQLIGWGTTTSATAAMAG